MQALEAHDIEKDVAAFIKKYFDDRYEPTWHCIVGQSFGASRSIQPVHAHTRQDAGQSCAKIIVAFEKKRESESRCRTTPTVEFSQSDIEQPLQGLLSRMRVVTLYTCTLVRRLV